MLTDSRIEFPFVHTNFASLGYRVLRLLGLACLLLTLVACDAFTSDNTVQQQKPVFPDYVPSDKVPTVSAQKVRITYTSDIHTEQSVPVPLNKWLESVEITPAADESHITHYNVYFGDILKNKLGLALAPVQARIPARRDGEVIRYEFPPGYAMDLGAVFVLVCTANVDKEFCAKENNLAQAWEDIQEPVQYTNALADAVDAADDMSCPGLSVMKTCGNMICDGTESVSSCPSDCMDYTVTSFNRQVFCDEVQAVYHPTSIDEIQQIVADANRKNQRVKVIAAAAIGGTTGSATGIVCTDGVLIVTDKMDFTNLSFPIKLETFEGQEVVNVPAGTKMHDLGEWLYERDKQLGFVHLGWRDATIAGAIGTSSHGSSPKHTNVVANKVVAMDVINPEGELKTYSRNTTGVTNPDLWKAMLTHLGYMGIITSVRVEVEPAQNVHVKVTFHDEDELFNSPSKVVFDDIKDCDYGQYNWFPTLGEYVRWCGKVTDQPAEKGANNTLLTPYGANGGVSFQPEVTEIMQSYQVGACFPDSDTTKTAGALRASSFRITPPLLKERDSKPYYTSDVIGPLHRVTSSHFDVTYPVLQMDWEVAVPFEQMQPALKYVNDFAHGMNEKNREIPMPLIGIFVRFSKSEDKGLLSYTGAGGGFIEGSTVLHIEMPIYVPSNMGEEQFREYMDAYETVNHTLIKNFGGRAHWGKNQYYFDGKSHPSIFELQRDLGVYGDRLERFNKAIAEFDPKGMFANRYAKYLGIVHPELVKPAGW